MTLPQDQIITLHSKIDSLHRLIEQLNEQIQFILPGEKSPTEKSVATVNSQVNSSMKEISSRSTSIFSSYDEEMIGHKDVISEPEHVDSNRSTSDQPLTSEVQVQRLTAQLTAAYNRIAALEEQLLSHRIH